MRRAQRFIMHILIFRGLYIVLIEIFIAVTWLDDVFKGMIFAIDIYVVRLFSHYSR